jgi:hypothetical protein
MTDDYEWKKDLLRDFFEYSKVTKTTSSHVPRSSEYFSKLRNDNELQFTNQMESFRSLVTNEMTSSTSATKTKRK